jgi:hypothetical protein
VVTHFYSIRGSGIFCAVWSMLQLYKGDSLKDYYRVNKQENGASPRQKIDCEFL